MTTKAKRMLKVFRQIPKIEKSLFGTSFFKTTPEDITNSESVELDIVRSDEDIAPVLTDISTGAHVVSEDIYTNKEIKPPAMALKMPFNVFDLTNRIPGETAYEADAPAQARLRVKILRSWEKMLNMMKRTIEFQAWQVLTSGTITLYDADGNARYTLDYKPKATHFPTAGISWSNTGTATPLDDLEGLSDTCRDDGLVDIVNVMMGGGSFKYFLENAKVEKYFSKDGYALGALSPQLLNNGAKFQGSVSVGSYEFKIWTYNARYIDPVTSTKKKYLADDKVVMLPDPEEVDFRKAFGAIPVVVDSDERFRDVLPARVSVPGAYDFKPRVFTDENAETVFTEIKSRPILIPVSIDRYGCLDTEI